VVKIVVEITSDDPLIGEQIDDLKEGFRSEACRVAQGTSSGYDCKDIYTDVEEEIVDADDTEDQVAETEDQAGDIEVQEAENEGQEAANEVQAADNEDEAVRDLTGTNGIDMGGPDGMDVTEGMDVPEDMNVLEGMDETNMGMQERLDDLSEEGINLPSEIQNAMNEGELTEDFLATNPEPNFEIEFGDLQLQQGEDATVNDLLNAITDGNIIPENIEIPQEFVTEFLENLDGAQRLTDLQSEIENGDHNKALLLIPWAEDFGAYEDPWENMTFKYTVTTIIPTTDELKDELKRKIDEDDFTDSIKKAISEAIPESKNAQFMGLTTTIGISENPTAEPSYAPTPVGYTYPPSMDYDYQVDSEWNNTNEKQDRPELTSLQPKEDDKDNVRAEDEESSSATQAFLGIQAAVFLLLVLF